MSTNSPSGFERAAIRIFWLIATGIVALMLAPALAQETARGNASGTTPVALLTGIVVAQVLLGWLIAGTVCGLVMERQPLHCNLYLLVILGLLLLLIPAVS